MFWSSNGLPLGTQKEKFQCKEKLWQKAMHIYKNFPNSKVIVLKELLNRLSHAIYKLVICAFILELYSMLISFFFFKCQFQLFTVCFKWSVSEIFTMKQLWQCGDHFVSLELCSIYHPTTNVLWRILNISEEVILVSPVVTVSPWQKSWLLLPAHQFLETLFG